MNEDKKYKITQNIELITIEDECILLDTAHFTVTQVNTAGSYILRALSEPKNLEEIVDLMQIEFGIDAMVAEVDSLEFLEEIRKVGLISYE